MNSFVKALNNEVSVDDEMTVTTNGMATPVSSNSVLVDLFFAIGSSRGKDISGLFKKALYENSDLAAKILLWSRDVREGAGERQTFRNLLNVLATENLDLAVKVARKIPELGRWDDFLSLEHPVLKEIGFGIIHNALNSGIKAENILKNINSMSETECKQILDSF
jgi:hypothetical protein